MSLPVKYSPNSCSSFMARSYVFLACSSVNLLFMSLQQKKFFQLQVTELTVVLSHIQTRNGKSLLTLKIREISAL